MGSVVSINKNNVGRIAERIVSNELEYRGFRVSDLNKEGTSVNADLLAAKDGKSWQIQVKGSTHDRGCWFNYGQCNQENISGGKPMFNRASSFYKAEIVALVCVETASAYCCILLPVMKAEELATLNIKREYRRANLDGSEKKPGKVWSSLDYIPPRLKDAGRMMSLRQEQAVLQAYRDKWDIDACALFSCDGKNS